MNKKITFGNLGWELKTAVILSIIAGGLIILNFILGIVYAFLGG